MHKPASAATLTYACRAARRTAMPSPACKWREEGRILRYHTLAAVGRWHRLCDGQLVRHFNAVAHSRRTPTSLLNAPTSVQARHLLRHGYRV